MTYHVPSVSLCREPGISMAERPSMTEPEGAAKVLHAFFATLEPDKEHFVVALLNVRHRIIGLNVVATGCLTSSLVHPRETFRPAIVGAAAAIILCHNHPSGDPEPSAEDIALTRRLTTGGALLGIEVLDHIILGEVGQFVHRAGFVSLRQRGIL